MKKSIVLVLMLILSISIVHAGFLDWITGRVTEETAIVKEEVKCAFLNANSEQKCYTDDGSFACSSTTTCIAGVSGENGKTLRWKSSCGGEVLTTIDGVYESAEFKCYEEQTIAQPPEPIPAVSPGEAIKEIVQCGFAYSNSEQKCYTDDGKFGCSGITSCAAEIIGENGKAIKWKSSCGSYAETVIDGVNQNIGFKCEQALPQSAQSPAPAQPAQMQCSDSEGKDYYVKGTAKDQYGEKTDHCYNEKELEEYWCQNDGKGAVMYIERHWCDYGCKEGVCLQMLNPVCGNGACESEDEKANCLQDCKDLIKCYQNSDCGQQTASKYCGPMKAPQEKQRPISACKSGGCECVNPGTYNSNCKCLIESCIPCPEGCKDGECLSVNPSTVKEPVPAAQAQCTDSDRGRNYRTKGYIKTQTGDYAEDSCENAGYLNEYYCADDKIYSDRIMCPHGCKDGLCLEESALVEACKDSDGTNIVSVTNGVFHPPGEDRYVKGSVNYGSIVYEDYCSKIAHYIDSAGNNNIKYDRSFEGAGIFEAGCLDGKTPYEASYFECPKGCKDGACITEEAAEQIKCIFTNSEGNQQCYIAGSYNAADEGTKFCKGKESCVINYKGNKGEQVAWKSTCGGYQYTTQDGNSEEIKFECKTGESNFNEIKNKGFRFAYWQCYGGSESKSEDTTSCKPSEIWQKYAAEFCGGKCGEDNSKCGVSSFSIWNECYSEGAAAIPTILAVPAESSASVAVPVQGTLYYFFDDNCPQCKNMDAEIGVLKQKGFFNNFGAAVFNIKDKDISQKYDIKAAPTLILYKDKCSFRKEGFMKSDEIESWAHNAKCSEEIKETSQPITEPILVCKDSCPSESKCYPFGYRKEGEFCSDEGAFREQLKEDSTCENNFECSTNVCVDGICISSGVIQKIVGWIKKLFGRADKEETREEIAKSMDCGTSSECMEDAFKTCKPAKMSQQGGPVSEIIIAGLENKKCVLKMTSGKESMTCKFENYTLGTKNLGSASPEKYCEGTLTYRLAAAPKMMKAGEAPVLNSAVVATKLSADSNDMRYSFTARDPDGIREFSIIKSDFGEVAVKAEPPCAKEFTSELKFNPSDLPLSASVIDCGAQVTRQELKLDIQIQIAEKKI